MRSIACAVLLALAVTATACSRVHAKTAPANAPNPALNVPSPPPHDVEATETEAPPPISLPEEPARNAPGRSRQPPPHEQPRADSPRPEPAKPETPPPPVPEQPKPEEPSRPSAPLQTMPTTAEGDMERQIRATVQRANADLNRIDYRALNKDARIQYDTAKRFIRQADDAIRAKNLLFAKNLAEKAATLAAQLSSR